MPNPVFPYISNLLFVNTFRRYTRLNDQTVLFLTNQFCNIHLFTLSLNDLSHSFPILNAWKTIQSIAGSLSDAITPGQNGPGSNGYERYSVFPKVPALLEPRLMSYQDTRCGSLTFCSPCILEPSRLDWLHQVFLTNTNNFLTGVFDLSSTCTLSMT